MYSILARVNSFQTLLEQFLFVLLQRNTVARAMRQAAENCYPVPRAHSNSFHCPVLPL